MLHSWRDPLLARFAPKAARLILAADPDGLLFEEEVQRGIRKSGYDLLLFEDPVSFRFAYESNYRARWLAGEDACVVVVVRGPAALLNQLPFDVLRTGVQMSFDLSELFPCLHHKVVAALDRSELDRLYQAQSQSSPGNLNETATKDYILGHVFGLAPVTINDAPDLLRSLLQRHYRDRHIPKVLDDHILRSRFAGGGGRRSGGGSGDRAALCGEHDLQPNDLYPGLVHAAGRARGVQLGVLRAAGPSVCSAGHPVCPAARADVRTARPGV